MRSLKFIFCFILIILSCSKYDDTVDVVSKEIIDDKPKEKNIIIASVNTNNMEIVDEPKIPGTLRFLQKDSTIFEGPIGIEIRGSSSQMFPKKSYGFETWDDENNDLNIELLDFPKEEDWIFYAPYSDKSLIRNVLIYELSNDIDFYASKTKFVELYVNNKYKGLYVFMEKIKRDKNRVNISKNKSEDISGGYILKIDKSTGDASNPKSQNEYNSFNSFTSNYNSLGTPDLNKGAKTHFLYEYPKSDDISEDQKSFIKKYINDFEDSLLSENFKDIDSGYSKWIDKESFIDFFLLNEIAKNIDGYRLSTFISKDKGGKLKMGPIWDFNLAFGNANYCGGESPEGWVYLFNDICPGDTWQVPFWWKRFMEDPNWKKSIKDRWLELRKDKFSSQNILKKISNYSKYLIDNNSIQENFSKWKILNKYIWPNYYIGVTYSDEITYLKDWINKRLIWMDSQINNF